MKAVFEVHEIGLFRDDGLAVINGNGHNCDKKRKETVKVFKEEGLKISCETNISRVCFLDVLFDLDQDCYKPYHKINSQVRYVDKGSNHPYIILQNIPYGINKRLSSIFSNEECFND